jgi:hypothetical protein
MTEAEWLACTDPTPMLEFLGEKASNRKLRLFAVACCRRVWQLVDDEPSRTAVDVAERLADGQATNAERRTAAVAGYPRKGPATIGWQAVACVVSLPAKHAADRTSHNSASALGRASTTIPYKPTSSDNTAYFAAVAEGEAKERKAQTPLLRDIIGTPFRSVVFDPSWCMPEVVKLAQVMYDQRAFDRMPELADALEEAGCSDADILDHCRQPGEHVRGCWVVDLLLGKE